MSAIEQLKVRLTGLKQNRHMKEEDLALHKKCVLGINAKINEATEEIEEYGYAIALLEEEQQHTVEKNRSKNQIADISQTSRCEHGIRYKSK